MASAPQSINLDECTPQQLEQLHQRFTEELQMLTSSMGTLKLALNKYKFSKEAINNLTVAKEETKETLVPLTSSLYIPGTIKSVKSVLVDVGTGYFVEKSLDGAQDYFDQKSEMVSKNIENVQGAIGTKREDTLKVRAALQQKMAIVAEMQRREMAKLDNIKDGK